MLGIRTWMRMRYVDDGRVALPAIKAGWRWSDGGLKFTKRWEQEDRSITGEQRTKEIIKNTLMAPNFRYQLKSWGAEPNNVQIL